MVARVSVCRKPAVLVALGFTLALAGCQSGNPLGALNIGGGERQQEPDDRVSADELLAYCPPITLRASDAIYNIYQRGGDNDPQQLVFSASMGDVTRSCVHGAGVLGMTVAAAGRVVPGPQGTTGTVRTPIRVTVYRDTEAVHDQVYDHQVTIADTAGATQFVFTQTNLSVPTPTSRNVRIFIGFDTQAPAGRR